MTEAGHVSGPAPRLRIKGRWKSVIRFFSISVAFMVLWILVTSQLGHYSKLFGPQILLQLNLAFYLPSIPVLILTGSLERVLDAQLGPIGSIALRLNSGLAGCLALAALFPLLPGLHPGDGPLWPLLTAVAVLGGSSAVAFSTSYQLVQYFRAADTIGLGVGCVGAGPLVLLVQLALGVGPSPAKWQWIAIYEISAGLIAAGLLSSSSLCGQYWTQLNDAALRGTAAAAAAAGDATAATDGADDRVPLLAAVDAAAATAAAAADAPGAWHGLDLAAAGGYRSPGSPYGIYALRPLSSGGPRVSYQDRPALSYRRGPSLAPDPLNIFSLLSPGLDGGFGWDDDDNDDAPPVLLRRSASAGVESSMSRAAAAARRREALAAAGLARPSRARTGRSPSNTNLYSQYTAALPNEKPNTPPSSPESLLTVTAAAAGRSAAAFATPHSALSNMTSAPAKMVRYHGLSARKALADTANNSSSNGGGGDGGGRFSDGAAVSGVLEFGVLDEVPVVQQQHQHHQQQQQQQQQQQRSEGPPSTRQPSCYPQRLPFSTVASSFASKTASDLLIRALQAPGRERDDSTAPLSSALAVAVVAPECQAASIHLLGDTSMAGMATKDVEAEYAAATRAPAPATPPPPAAAAAVALTVSAAAPLPLTLRQEVLEVLRGSWQVMLGFTVDVTLLYIVFPFFTYVPTSGWLKDSLPQVLFYARLFTDLIGRLLPRRRALQLRSGTAILFLAGVSTAAGALFFAYILAPEHLVAKAPRLLRNDVVPLALVVLLWLTGGYTNTMSNMLAPSMVAPGLAGRASALMALLFNVAHIGGLIIAAAMALALFGDVVG